MADRPEDDVSVNDDNDELLQKDDHSQEPDTDTDKEHVGHWAYLVPLVILYVLSRLPVMLITAQYMYQKVQEEMNVTLSIGGKNSTTACQVNYTDPDYIRQQSVQAETASWSIYIQLAHFPISLIMTIVYGIYSDHLGRHITFILPLIGSMLSCLILMAMQTFDLPIWWFYFTGVEYLFGGVYTFFMGCYSYIADTSAPETRGTRMTILEAIVMFSSSVAELFIGVWIKYGGFLPPLYFVLTCKLMCLIYVIFFIPETIKKRTVVVQTNPSVKGASIATILPTQKAGLSIKDMKHGFLLFLNDNGTGRRWKLNILLLSYILTNVFGVFHIITLFEMNSPLCWHSDFIGYFGSVSNGIACVVTLLGALILRRYLSEAWVVVIAYSQNMISNLYTAFVTTTIMMFFRPILGAMASLAVPMMRGIMSKLVSKHEQGAMFSIMTCTDIFSSIISTVSVNKVYKSTILFYEGFVFLVRVVICFLSLACVLFYIWKSAREKKTQREGEHLIDVS